jgi:hypothetical protein
LLKILILCCFTVENGDFNGNMTKSSLSLMEFSSEESMIMRIFFFLKKRKEKRLGSSQPYETIHYRRNRVEVGSKLVGDELVGHGLDQHHGGDEGRVSGEQCVGCGRLLFERKHCSTETQARVQSWILKRSG